MKIWRVTMYKDRETELDSNKQELLKEIFGYLHVSPECIEELMQQIKKRNQN